MTDVQFECGPSTCVVILEELLSPAAITGHYSAQHGNQVLQLHYKKNPSTCNIWSDKIHCEGYGVVKYSDCGSLEIHLSNLADTIIVHSLSCNLIIIGGDGDDVYKIVYPALGSPASPYTITIQESLEAKGDDSLFVDAAPTDNQTPLAFVATLTSSNIQFTSSPTSNVASIDYQGIESFKISLGGGADIFNIVSAPPQSFIEVYGCGGDDVVNIGLSGSFSGINPQLLKVSGTCESLPETFIENTLNVDLSSYPSAILTITKEEIQLNINPTLSVTIIYDSFANLNMRSSQSAITNIKGTDSATTFYGGPGDDRFYISSESSRNQSSSVNEFLTGTLKLIQGPVNIIDTGGNNLLYMSDASNTLDVGCRTAGTLTSTSLVGIAPAPITWSPVSFCAGFALWLGSGKDCLNIVSLPNQLSNCYTTYSWVSTGAGDDTVVSSVVDPVNSVHASYISLVLFLDSGNDILNATTNQMSLLVFGNADDDTMILGGGPDSITNYAFGDSGSVAYTNGVSFVSSRDVPPFASKISLSAWTLSKITT